MQLTFSDFGMPLVWASANNSLIMADIFAFFSLFLKFQWGKKTPGFSWIVPLHAFSLVIEVSGFSSVGKFLSVYEVWLYEDPI